MDFSPAHLWLIREDALRIAPLIKALDSVPEPECQREHTHSLGEPPLKLILLLLLTGRLVENLQSTEAALLQACRRFELDREEESLTD